MYKRTFFLMRSIFVLLAWLALAGSQAFAEDDTIL
jgi:hypothetical protein